MRRKPVRATAVRVQSTLPAADTALLLAPQAPTAGWGRGMRFLSPSPEPSVAARRLQVPARGTPALVPGASQDPRRCLGSTPTPGTSALFLCAHVLVHQKGRQSALTPTR